MLRRATLNLVLNAIDAMPSGGELAVTGTAGSRGVELEIADSGPGIQDGDSPRLFEPFFTTKSGGTGLGLTIVERIASAHGGDVSARNCPQGGAAFTIRLPYRQMEAAA
jgi:signal transduction histidine kinase